MKDELTTSEVAARMDASPITVRLWCRRGLFPNAREVQESRGSVWKIPASDLKDFKPPKPTGRPRTVKTEGVKPAKKKGGKK
jgi:hypothetical protein